ncbi:MAG: hypothetical protein JXR31_12090 [Prolixibacteraceae bacterium]|nr:hypothetical protein [Prolixibacteraceae bacterium]
METASISILKKELQLIPPEKVIEHCIRLAKYKKENKELLSYLLFEAANEQAFIKQVQGEIDEQFENLNSSSIYLAKKTVRKVLKTTNKYIRFSEHKTTEIELLIYFCKKLRKSGLPISRSRILRNLYQRQFERINKVLKMLHEDLQFDYKDDVEMLKK